MLLNTAKRWVRGGLARGGSATLPTLMDQLESRTLFGTTPFPNVNSLENVNDTVVRVETNFGVIDIEMLDTVAPGTVTNFLNYVRHGNFDETFFHRLVPGFVLQGGGYRFRTDTDPNLTAIPTDPPIQNEFSRSNTIRTIAMAKLGGNPNSATSQFFINLADNSANLDNQNGGFTVFGRIVNDASWNVVMAIAGLGQANLTGAPEFVDSPSAPVMQQVPVTTDYHAPHVTEASLVNLTDVEIIKAANTTLYYTQTVYYPEGFAGSTINEFLPLGNPNSSAVNYQVIAHSEVVSGDVQTPAGWFRDRVISTGIIPPNSRGGITISQFGAGGAPGVNDLVPQGVPYALEVRSTVQLAANLSHYDFGTSTGEAFTATPNTMWGFGEITKENGSDNDFLVWQNPNDADANLTITFYFQNLAPATINVTTQALRRGGLSIQNVAQVPDHTLFSAMISSDIPIVAALSHYDNRGDQEGSTALGVPGTGSRVGIIPMGSAGTGTSQEVGFLNVGSVAAVVTMVISFENPAQEVTVAPTLIIQPMSRQSFDLATLPNARVQAGDRFSIRYSVAGGVQVYASDSHSGMTDAVSNPFAIEAARAYNFAEGFMDPARAGINVFETVSLYNPNSTFFTGNASVTANVTFTFLYTDGFSFSHTATIEGGGRLDLDMQTFQPILDQGTQNGRFFYSIRVDSDIAITAQMFHYDLTLGGLQASGGFSTLGMPVGPTTRLDSL
jgi:cyclophilin family peptidyl-prolyl cis-trans isomerase